MLAVHGNDMIVYDIMIVFIECVTLLSLLVIVQKKNCYVFFVAFFFHNELPHGDARRIRFIVSSLN